MNNNGWVVGWSRVGEHDWPRHAFLYKDGQMIDLNTLIDPDSGWELFEAHDINDHGQIVGVGYLDGEIRAFLMVPEPAALSLLAMGALAMLKRRRKS